MKKKKNTVNGQNDAKGTIKEEMERKEGKKYSEWTK